MTDNIKYERSENMTVAQDKRGLILTTDACLLSAFCPRNAKNNACELGAGSGIISVMLLRSGKIRTSVCVDFQQDICRIAEENAENNGLHDKMRVICADVLDFKYEKKFDLVVCNPPYFKENCGKTNISLQDRLTRHETTAKINDFALCAARNLKDGGTVCFCYTPSRTPELMAALENSGLSVKKTVFVYPTKDHKPCLVLMSAKKGAEPGCEISRPLIIYRDIAGGEFTEDYLRIKRENKAEL